MLKTITICLGIGLNQLLPEWHTLTWFEERSAKNIVHHKYRER